LRPQSINGGLVGDSRQLGHFLPGKRGGWQPQGLPALSLGSSALSSKATTLLEHRHQLCAKLARQSGTRHAMPCPHPPTLVQALQAKMPIIKITVAYQQPSARCPASSRSKPSRSKHACRCAIVASAASAAAWCSHIFGSPAGVAWGLVVYAGQVAACVGSGHTML